MNTISTISSISYNSEPFFELTAKRLQSGGLADWVHWIKHKPETDETKEHIHFILKPSKRIDTNSLRKEFIEIAAGEPKPRCVLPFVKSNIKDWLLYAVHDIKYLFKKGQTRKCRYDRSEVKSTEPDFLAQQWQDATDPIDALTLRVIEMKEAGQTWGEVLQTGLIAPNQVYYWRQVYFESCTNRNGRKGHEEGGV